jgi:hypothetical protein
MKASKAKRSASTSMLPNVAEEFERSYERNGMLYFPLSKSASKLREPKLDRLMIYGIKLKPEEYLNLKYVNSSAYPITTFEETVNGDAVKVTYVILYQAKLPRIVLSETCATEVPVLPYQDEVDKFVDYVRKNNISSSPYSVFVLKV